ncbi:MAG: bacillithiol biosynthesis deacetylase BshB1 [Flavobacteriales bacterium]|nr:bacillithiol biosynthesis deacetylase BshB1 [Flavobacteriales bacterium]
MKVDILAFGAHPDDIELGAAGTLISHIHQGKSVGLVDLTYGELGSRGNKEIRLQEAAQAKEIIGASTRMNLGMPDGFFQNDEKHQKEVIRIIRHFRPDIVICNAPTDRHPDHGRASQLVSDACFYAGLTKITTQWVGKYQDPWRPKIILHYIQYYDLKPDVLVDISGYMDLKMESIKAHQSQFYNPNSKEPETLISQPEFLDNVINRAAYYGQYIGVKYAEGFITQRTLGIQNLFHLL